MHRIKAILITITLAIGSIITAAYMLAPPAHASGIPSVCAQGGAGYCLNDWNGNTNNGAPVKMYGGGVTNDSFNEYILTNYCNNGHVDANTSCPFPAGSGLNTQFNNGLIIKIESNLDTSKCIGTDINAFADMGPCPPLNGSGRGSNLFVEATDSNCSAGSDAYLEDVYWSGQHGAQYNLSSSLISGGSIGAQAYVVINGETSSCWGSVNT